MQHIYLDFFMDNWNEIKTAACVARCGTISAAANELGVHRATINRHIDALEAQLGGKLFQRHARGFTPTELGHELLRIADATDEQFAQLKRIANRTSDELTGEFIITSIDALAPSAVSETFVTSASDVKLPVCSNAAPAEAFTVRLVAFVAVIAPVRVVALSASISIDVAARKSCAPSTTNAPPVALISTVVAF